MGYQMPITLLLVALAICVLVWWVTPSVLVEAFQLRNKTLPPRTSNNSQSRALGSWLSRGLDATSVVTFSSAGTQSFWHSPPYMRSD